MKRTTSTTLLATTAVLSIAAVVTKISEYPNTTTLSTNDLFVVASGATNKNIKYGDLRSIISSLNWTNYTLTDSEGGTAHFLDSVSQSPVTFGVNYLTNFWAEPSDIILLGRHTAADVTALATDGASIYGLGYKPFNGSFVTNSSWLFALGVYPSATTSFKDSDRIFSWGYETLYGSLIKSSSALFAYGNHSMEQSRFTNVTDIFGYGTEALANSTNQGSLTSSVYAYGYRAFYGVNLTNSSDLYSFGNNAGASLSGSNLTHIFLAGSGSVPTASGDWVAGDSAYRYKFPGTNGFQLLSSLTFPDGTVQSTASGGNVTNTYNTIIVTNQYVSNLFVTNVTVGGKHTIIQSLELLYVGPNKILRTDANTNVAAVTIGSGLSFDGTTLTASGGGGGSVTVNGTNVTNPNFKDTADITWAIGTSTNAQPSFALQSFNAITFSSGTNLNAMDCSLGNSYAAVYKLSLTNNAYFGVPTSIPTSPKFFYVWLQQDATGGRTVTWTNGFFKFPGGVVPVPDLTSNAVSLVVFATQPFTNNVLCAMPPVQQFQ